jgi:hypothetical protein
MEAVKAQRLLPIEVAPRVQTGYIGICEGCAREITGRPCAIQLKDDTRLMVCAKCYTLVCTLERLTAKGVLR